MIKVYRKENKGLLLKGLLLLDEVEWFDEAHDVMFEDIDDRGIFDDYVVDGDEDEM